MNTAALHLNMYEALVDAGVKPDLARDVERRVETAFQAQQDKWEAQLHEQHGQLMSKRDGEQLRVDVEKLRLEVKDTKIEMLKTMNEQTWRLVGFMVVFNSLLVGLLKFLP